MPERVALLCSFGHSLMLPHFNLAYLGVWQTAYVYILLGRNAHVNVSMQRSSWQWAQWRSEPDDTKKFIASLHGAVCA